MIIFVLLFLFFRNYYFHFLWICGASSHGWAVFYRMPLGRRSWLKFLVFCSRAPHLWFKSEKKSDQSGWDFLRSKNHRIRWSEPTTVQAITDLIRRVVHEPDECATELKMFFNNQRRGIFDAWTTKLFNTAQPCYNTGWTKTFSRVIPWVLVDGSRVRRCIQIMNLNTFSWTPSW